jgi:hypothetical protein
LSRRSFTGTTSAARTPPGWHRCSLKTSPCVSLRAGIPDVTDSTKPYGRSWHCGSDTAPDVRLPDRSARQPHPVHGEADPVTCTVRTTLVRTCTLERSSPEWRSGVPRAHGCPDWTSIWSGPKGIPRRHRDSAEVGNVSRRRAWLRRGSRRARAHRCRPGR